MFLTGTSPLSEVHILDLTTNTWQCVQLTGEIVACHILTWIQILEAWRFFSPMFEQNRELLLHLDQRHHKMFSLSAILAPRFWRARKDMQSKCTAEYNSMLLLLPSLLWRLRLWAMSVWIVLTINKQADRSNCWNILSCRCHSPCSWAAEYDTLDRYKFLDLFWWLEWSQAI